MRQPLRAEVRLTLGDLARAIGVDPPPDAAMSLGGVATDSRDVRPGDLFVALAGERRDGGQFLDAARRAGAAAALLQRLPSGDPGLTVVLVEDTMDALGRLAGWWRRRCPLRLVAVTGSNGKTTTKEMIAAAMVHHSGDARSVLSTQGNFNNHIGLPLTLLGARPTMDLGVVEMGMSGPGEIDRLAALAEPQVGLVTNAAEAHLGGLGDVRGVAEAKAELWGRLDEGACAVVPADDPRLVALAAERFGGKRVTFGEEASAEVRLVKATSTAEGGLEVLLATGGRQIGVELPLLGRHNGLNAAAAMAACLALEMDPEVVAEGLGRTAAPPHRARLARAPGLTLLDDCYNANPASVRAGVRALAEIPGEGELGVVLGDMLELGERAEELHRQVGAELAELGVGVVVGLGPLAAILCESARLAGVERVAPVESAAAAASAVRSLLAPGGRLLVKGSRSMGLEAVVRHLQREEQA